MIARGTLQVTRWLALLFAAVSLFLLTQRLLGLGPGAAAGDLVASYRALFYPLANLFEPAVNALFELLRLALPAWWREGLVLYFLFGAAHYRHFTNEILSIADVLSMPAQDRQARVGAAVLTIALLCAMVWPLSLLVLPLIDLAVGALAAPGRAVGRFLQFYGQVLFQTAVLTAGTGLFLLFDAGLR